MGTGCSHLFCQVYVVAKSVHKSYHRGWDICLSGNTSYSRVQTRVHLQWTPSHPPQTTHGLSQYWAMSKYSPFHCWSESAITLCCSPCNVLDRSAQMTQCCWHSVHGSLTKELSTFVHKVAASVCELTAHWGPIWQVAFLKLPITQWMAKCPHISLILSI